MVERGFCVPKCPKCVYDGLNDRERVYAGYDRGERSREVCTTDKVHAGYIGHARDVEMT
jgi:hypothetical protein